MMNLNKEKENYYKMRQTLLLTTLVSILLIGCSAPVEKKGNEFLNEFSQSINDIDKSSSIGFISYFLESAKSELEENKLNFTEKEELSLEEIELLNLITRYDTIEKYLELSSYIDSRNQLALELAQGETWISENENPKKQLGLITFDDNEIVMVNRKKSYSFSYASDNYLFTNENGKEFLLDDVDGYLVMYTEFSNPHRFKKASPYEKIMGKWRGKWGNYFETYNVTLKLTEEGKGSIISKYRTIVLYPTRQKGNKYNFKDKDGYTYDFTFKGGKLYLTDKVTFSRIDKEESTDFTDIFNYPKYVAPPQSASTYSTSTESSSSPNASPSSASEDWDEMLDDYEEYIDQYIILYKKAMKGDQSAILEYGSMLEKAASLQASIKKAQSNNDLSTAQINRMMAIVTKMNNAMLEVK